jgi:hypothetical protein
MWWNEFDALTSSFTLPAPRIPRPGRHAGHDAGDVQEEPSAGKPHARICEGEAEWPSYSTAIRAANCSGFPALGQAISHEALQPLVLLQQRQPLAARQVGARGEARLVAA